MKKILLSCLLPVLLFSCAHVISPENRENALSAVAFNEIRADAEQHADKTFILGGIVADTLNTEEGSELEVVQMPLDERGYVLMREKSGGRFIVLTEEHLDPLIFRKGREVTIAGVLTGTRTQKLSKKDYTYPLFRAKEIYLAPRTVYYRDTDYGYDPYYYPYPPYLYDWPYDPYPYYWYNPFIFRPSMYFHYRNH